MVDSPLKKKIYLDGCGYAKYYSPSSKKSKYYHRLLVDAQPGQVVDHRDGQRMNNTRENLRIVTHAENMINRPMNRKNTSGVPNVSWHKPTCKWHAKIKHESKTKHLGYFHTKQAAQEAVQAWDRAHPEIAQFRRK